jgi:hypothetical protein
MKESTMQEIRNFLNCDTIAMAGVSRKNESFSANAVKHLEKNGYKIMKINPNIAGDDIPEGWYANITDLPEGVNNLLVVTNPKDSGRVIDDALAKGIGNIWIQQKSETGAVMEKLESSGCNYVWNRCIIMMTNPTGFHKFHYFMTRLFRKLPK